jgi:XTP/dITP diphosphohydrolase
MIRQLFVGSGNKKKLEELRSLLEPLRITLLGPSDFEPTPAAPDETETTFLGNARLKALAYAKATNLLTLADDSGLCVDALDGRPGVYSARFAFEGASDEDNTRLLLKELEGVPMEKRTARYVCVLALASRKEVLFVAQGICEGHILLSPKGQSGFGYDPLFSTALSGKTFAELKPEEKAKISHRGQALRSFIQSLPQVLATFDSSVP